MRCKCRGKVSLGVSDSDARTTGIFRRGTPTDPIPAGIFRLSSALTCIFNGVPKVLSRNYRDGLSDGG